MVTSLVREKLEGFSAASITFECPRSRASTNDVNFLVDLTIFSSGDDSVLISGPRFVEEQ